MDVMMMLASILVVLLGCGVVTFFVIKKKVTQDTAMISKMGKKICRT